jgi:hypothetical protein
VKKNIGLLVSISLISGGFITIGMASFLNDYAWSNSNCEGPSGTPQIVASCTTAQSGYPQRFLHSNTLISLMPAGVSTPPKVGNLVLLTYPWVEKKPMLIDWALWSGISLLSLGTLFYLLERLQPKNTARSKKLK